MGFLAFIRLETRLSLAIQFDLHSGTDEGKNLRHAEMNPQGHIMRTARTTREVPSHSIVHYGEG
jgi:hypothetical protein